MTDEEYVNLKVDDRVAWSDCSDFSADKVTKVVRVTPSKSSDGSVSQHLVFVEVEGQEYRVSESCCINLYQKTRDMHDCHNAINRWRDKHHQRRLDVTGWSAKDVRMEAMRLGV